MTHSVSDESCDLQVTSQAPKTGSIIQYGLVPFLPHPWALVLWLVFGMLPDLKGSFCLELLVIRFIAAASQGHPEEHQGDSEIRSGRCTARSACHPERSRSSRGLACCRLCSRS
jgi:hypothetical protein